MAGKDEFEVKREATIQASRAAVELTPFADSLRTGFRPAKLTAQ